MDAAPDGELIKQWALESLPAHYVLKKVEFGYGSDRPELIPEDFAVKIEYVNCLDEPHRGSSMDIEAHEEWSCRLRERIRGRWSPQEIRIDFVERGNEGSGAI